MPQVSTYGPPRVSTRPLPDTSRTDVRTPDSFGAGVGRSLTQIGVGLIEAQSARERQRANEIAILEAENRLSSWETERLYDPERGALRVTGKNAVGLTSEVLTELDQVGAEVLGTLKTPEQQQAIRVALARRRQAIALTLERHAFDELGKYDLAQTQAYLQNVTSAAIAAVDEPRRVFDELGRGEAAIRQHGARTGQPAEQTEQTLEVFRTTVHAGVIDRLLATGRDAAARGYFQEVEGQIGGEALARIERALEAGQVRAEAQQRADDILAHTTTQTAALEVVRAIEDPELRDAVEDRVVRGYQLRKQAQAEAEEAALTQAVNLLEAARGDLAAIPPALWETFTVSQRASMRSYAKAIAPGGPGEVETHLPTYFQLRTLAVEDPAAFAKVNLPSYIGRLGKTEFKELTDIWLRLKEGKSVTEQVDSFATRAEVWKGLLTEFGFDEGSDEALELQRELDKRVEAASRVAPGQKLTNTEIREIADRLVGTVVLERGGWLNFLPGGRPFFDRTKKAKDITIRDIPAGDRAQVEQELRSARPGRPVTEDMVLDTWLRWKQSLGEIQ